MTAPDAAAREKLAKDLYNVAWMMNPPLATWGTATGSKAAWERAADFILARQREREGPLLEWIHGLTRLHPDSPTALRRVQGGAMDILARHAALDAPPPRTVEQIAADVVANRKHGYEKFIATLDELAAALARLKEQG